MAVIPFTEERKSSTLDNSEAVSPVTALCLLRDPNNIHLIASTLGCKGQGWSSGLVHLQPPSPLSFQPWTFNISSPPFTRITIKILTSYSLPLAVPRDYLKRGFLEGKGPTTL